ncbi:hypothetical protein ACTFIZ_002293 [Dictyostelium cf. discoideum]
MNGLIQLGIKLEQLFFPNKVRVCLFMKLYNKKIQHELATSAYEVYNNTIGWNEFKLTVKQEISTNSITSKSSIKLKESYVAYTIVTSGINLIGEKSRLNEEVINKQSLVSLTSDLDSNSSSTPNNQVGTDSQSRNKGFSSGWKFNNGQRSGDTSKSNNSRFNGLRYSNENRCWRNITSWDWCDGGAVVVVVTGVVSTLLG